MTIDINCDLGEGTNNDHLLMPLISSCNIACGGHFGDATTVDTAIDLAIKYNVKIGAHPSFPDTINFGRKFLDIPADELSASLKNQLDFFTDRLQRKGLELHHIKPHGALYNAVATNEKLATLFVKSLQDYLENSILYVPYSSQIEKIAKANNLKIKYEVFADRNYNDDLTLVSRQSNKAMLIDKEKVEQHVLTIIQNNMVQTISGNLKKIKADTICIHSDSQNAHTILQQLVNLLTKKGLYGK